MSWLARPGPERPVQRYAAGLQHERTALAWERTAFAMMGLGVILARFAAVEGFDPIAFAGLVIVGLGVGLVVWASVHYEARHAALRREEDLAHPGAARFVGIAATAGSLLCLGAGVLASL